MDFGETRMNGETVVFIESFYLLYTSTPIQHSPTSLYLVSNDHNDIFII
jgi:hypothetical protein